MSDDVQRYEAVKELDPAVHDIAQVIGALGDPSWRVRKAAVHAALRFTQNAGLIPALVASLASEDNAGLRNAASETLVTLGAPAVQTLARSIARGDADQRKFIVEVLGAIGNADAQAALFAAQDDDDMNVRAAVAESLGRIGGEAVISELRRRLQGTQDDLQLAVYVLDALARTAARVPLAELQWFASNPSLARSLYPVLGNTGDRAAIPLLLDAIATAPEGNRYAAILALDVLTNDTAAEGELGEALRTHVRAHERLLAALDAERDEVVASAIALLSTTRDPSLAPKFLAAAACRTVVETAVDASRALGRPVTKFLLQEVDRVGVEARVLFLEVLECLADPTSVTDLLELSRGSETRSSEAAMRALGAFGDPAVIAPLMDLTKREDQELARQAVFALISVALRYPYEVAQAVHAAIDSGDLRAGWLIVLGAVGRDAEIPTVVSGTRHSEPDIRAAAIDAAAAFGSRFPRETLVFALTDEHAEVRGAATRALAEHRGDEVVAALVAASSDPVAEVAASALRALGNLGGTKALHTLHKAVASAVSPLAIAALQSLFVLAPPDLEDAVRTAIVHADPEVVREGIDVTLRLPAEVARPHLLAALSHPSWAVRRAAAESLVNRALTAPLDMLSERLRSETEPLVREELERLSRVSVHA